MKRKLKLYFLFFLILSIGLMAFQEAPGSDGLTSLVEQLLGLVGVGGLIAFLVNVGKIFKIVKEGQGQIWATGLNLLVLVILYLLPIFGIELDLSLIDSSAATIVQIGTFVLQLIGMFGGAKATHYFVKGTPVIGYAYS